MFYTFMCPRVYVAFILDMIIAFNEIINNNLLPAWYFSLIRTGSKKFIIVSLSSKMEQSHSWSNTSSFTESSYVGLKQLFTILKCFCY